MATVDLTKTFAAQAVKVERVLQQAGVPGNAGRILLVLKMADTQLWVRQKEVEAAMGTARDVVCKLVKHLHDYGLLQREPDPTNKKINLLQTTDLGRQILADVDTALGGHRSRVAKTKSEPLQASLFDRVAE